MIRCYDIGQYINTVKANDSFFRNYYFHSIIDLNLVKLDYILKYGILSRKEIEELKLLSFYVHSIRSYDCKNGMDYISLVDYDKLYRTKYDKEPTFSQFFEAFSLHTLTSLSLMIDRNIKVNEVGSLESNFDDEVFAYEKITRENIKGIILPEHLTNKQLKDISFLPGDSYCYTPKALNHLLDYLEIYFDKKIYRKELLKSVEQAWNIANESERPSITVAIKSQKERYGVDMRDILSSIIHELWEDKTSINNPTYIEIIKFLNKDLSIYEIGSKKLIKKQ
ncbi:MAG: hypothetical protein ACI31M_03340 [Bacilli bacterium]